MVSFHICFSFLFPNYAHVWLYEYSVSDRVRKNNKKIRLFVILMAIGFDLELLVLIHPFIHSIFPSFSNIQLLLLFIVPEFSWKVSENTRNFTHGEWYRKRDLPTTKQTVTSAVPSSVRKIWFHQESQLLFESTQGEVKSGCAKQRDWRAATTVIQEGSFVGSLGV